MELEKTAEMKTIAISFNGACHHPKFVENIIIAYLVLQISWCFIPVAINDGTM